MRLYKMELFKLFQNKIFKIGMLATTGLLFLYFWFAEVGGEIATVDGKFYSGYEAVQMNRKNMDCLQKLKKICQGGEMETF